MVGIVLCISDVERDYWDIVFFYFNSPFYLFYGPVKLSPIPVKPLPQPFCGPIKLSYIISHDK
jgi:hypothetical protein